MSGICAKNLHPACALVGYTVITALVFAGLLASPFDMFVAVGIPTCMAGTTSTYYQYTPSPVPGSPVPPNAPTTTSVPFCTSDALINSYNIQYNAYGYIGTVTGFTNVFYGYNEVTSIPYCLKKSNGTCPTFSDQGANTFTVQTVSGSSMFSITDAKLFMQAGGGRSFANYNNYPITFASGSALPSTSAGALDSSKTYYVRNFGFGMPSPSPSPSPSPGGPTFGIAADTSGNPLIFTGIAPSNTITATFPSLGSCASQQNVQPASATNPANMNLDGTLKTGSCGYCLTQTQQTGVLAVPGLCGTTLALLLIMELLMCVPVVRKMGFFRILVIVISVLCLIFLIAAVAGAAVMFSRVAQCFAQMDFNDDQLMPSPTGAAPFGGYTPSSGGAPLFGSGGRGGSPPGSYTASQVSGSAAYIKPLIIPSAGAGLLIIAIVLLFLFTIFFGIKTDWTAVSSGGDSSSATMMTPR
jgi:hypothetical protein